MAAITAVPMIATWPSARSISMPPVTMAYTHRAATIVTAPVITVSVVTTVADESLATTATVISIPRPVLSVAYPWARLIYHNLIAVIHIITTVSYRQISPVHPSAAA
jgi:hypothetical protein